MFKIMFMRQKRNENRTTHLNRATWTIYPLGSQFKLPRGASSLEQMRLLGHANIMQHCEIQWEALEFSEEHKWLWYCHNTSCKAPILSFCFWIQSENRFLCNWWFLARISCDVQQIVVLYYGYISCFPLQEVMHISETSEVVQLVRIVLKFLKLA